MFLQFVADYWFWLLVLSGLSLWLAIEVARKAKYINRPATALLVFAFFISLALAVIGAIVNAIAP